jgi:hypothetical protein
MLPDNSPLSSIHTTWHKLQQKFSMSLIFATWISTATGFQLSLEQTESHNNWMT